MDLPQARAKLTSVVLIVFLQTRGNKALHGPHRGGLDLLNVNLQILLGGVEIRLLGVDELHEMAQLLARQPVNVGLQLYPLLRRHCWRRHLGGGTFCRKGPVDLVPVAISRRTQRHLTLPIAHMLKQPMLKNGVSETRLTYTAEPLLWGFLCGIDFCCKHFCCSLASSFSLLLFSLFNLSFFFVFATGPWLSLFS